MKKTLFGMSMLVLGAATLLSSCSSNRKAGGGSSKTGWSYGDSKLGGFENVTRKVSAKQIEEFNKYISEISKAYISK
jgi:hypothetical protein